MPTIRWSGSVGNFFPVVNGNASALPVPLLIDPAILILDEATSAVDTENRARDTGSLGQPDPRPHDDCHRPPP